MQLNKRASLEISIQAIVIVVLAMTLLGLGLTLIRGMFKNIGETTDRVTEQVKQRVIDDLVSSDKKVSFPSTEIYIDKGASQILTVGIRNKKDEDLFYTIHFVAVSDPNGNLYGDPNALAGWFKYAQPASQSYVLSSADSDVRNIRLEVPSSSGVISGTYVFRFEVIDVQATGSDQIYAQKDFFVVVRG